MRFSELLYKNKLIGGEPGVWGSLLFFFPSREFMSPILRTGALIGRLVIGSSSHRQRRRQKS
jgi:hypothetical protein